MEGSVSLAISVYACMLLTATRSVLPTGKARAVVSASLHVPWFWLLLHIPNAPADTVYQRLVLSACHMSILADQCVAEQTLDDLHTVVCAMTASSVLYFFPLLATGGATLLTMVSWFTGPFGYMAVWLTDGLPLHALFGLVQALGVWLAARGLDVSC